MIITRTPLRITLGGGGTDLPSYYEQFGGFVLSAAVNRYIYIVINRTFSDEYLIKYSELERTTDVDLIEHPIVREALRLHPMERGIELVSVADIPAGTGLGSSGAFTVGVLRAIYAYRREHVTAANLAQEACEIEIERLGRPVGKQDQYIAAFGGLTCMSFEPDGQVSVSPILVSNDTLQNLEEHLCMYFTGYSRAADSVLSDQKVRSEQGDRDMLANLHYVKENGQATKVALERGDMSDFAALMHDHWLNKRKRSADMSNSQIDKWYDKALDHGAVGGKLVGAGSGGFLLFYAKDQDSLRSAMVDEGLREVRFTFDHDGSNVLVPATDMQCVILAGGRGTRMAPHTDVLPKALLPVAGRPFADWQLEWLAAQGVDEVVYSIGHLGDQIRRHVGDGDQWGLKVRYVDEGANLRGTGGALRQALEASVLAEQFLVLYGDSYLCVDVRNVWDAFLASKRAALMSVYLNDGQWEQSNAVLSDGLVTSYQKGLTRIPREMRYVDYGLSVFRASTVERWIPRNAVVDLADTFTKLSAARELAGYEAVERFYEIGSPSGLKALEARLATP